MATAITIRGITKAFPGAAAPAVDGVSLDIAPGELFFLLGPSGCGKTTLLRMIAGFIEPTRGSISFNGRVVTHLPPNRRNTGMVFQSYALWPHMTVAQNVGFGLSVRKVSREPARERVLAALRAVRMEDYLARRPNQLSGGQQQRIALARALVVRPDVLLLDEPLSNLDAKLRIELRSEIRRICKETGITTVYVTHDQKEALSMADRIAIMDRGGVVQIGPPRELYHAPRSRFVAEFLGETNFVPAVVASRDGGTVTLSSGGGTLVSSHPGAEAFAAGTKVVCSIRPESLRIVEQDGSLAGRIVDSIYLGEQAQHLVEIAAGIQVKVLELNPNKNRSFSVQLKVLPDDVVVLS